MITLIGARCKHSNMFSRGVLIRPLLLGNVKIAMFYDCFCLVLLPFFDLQFW